MVRRLNRRRSLLPRGHAARVAWRAARIGVAMLAVSLALAVGALAATTLYGEYGAPRTDASARAWAGRNLVYTITGCQDCHREQAATAAGGGHDGLICETCHRPTVSHPGPITGVVQAMDTQTSTVCATCHAAAPGRSLEFPQVDPDRHYPGAVCLQCHDPHSATAASPPVVTHPLQRLPECTTCHAPDGLKRFPEGHRLAPDSVCLGCHRTTGRVP